MPACCHDPKNYRDQPADKVGLIRSTCAVCRRFIGFRPADAGSNKPAKGIK